MQNGFRGVHLHAAAARYLAFPGEKQRFWREAAGPEKGRHDLSANWPPKSDLLLARANCEGFASARFGDLPRKRDRSLFVAIKEDNACSGRSAALPLQEFSVSRSWCNHCISGATI
jgi:hypothetical protein